MHLLLIFFLVLIIGKPSELIALSFYSFLDEPIDVVIPCVEKDLSTINLCIAGIRENGTNIRRIIVVSKNEITKQAEWFSEEAFPFSMQDVAAALANGNIETEKKLLQKGSRTGWYYQQLLKLYASQVIPNLSSNILILDSDTIFLNPVNFLNEKHGGLYNPGIEYNPPYFQHGASLIPGFAKRFPEYSGISHHMIFQKSVIEDLFNTVEQIHGKPFWEVFCRSVNPYHLFHSGASEYEIYFNYIFSRTDQVSIRKLKWANINKLSLLPRYKKRGYQYVSVHSYDRS